MGEPITWRNVVGPSLADASLPLRAAQQSFDSGFNIINQAIAQRQEAAQGAFNRQNDLAKQGYLNDLASIDNVDTLLGHRQAFMERLQGLTPEAQAAVRGRFDQRVTDLRNQVLQSQQFNTQQRQYAEAEKAAAAQPIVDRLVALANSNDKDARASSQAALDRYSAEGMIPHSGDIMAKLVGADRGAQEFGFKVNEDKRSQTKLDDQLQTNASTRASADASRQESSLRRELTQAQLDQAKREETASKLLSDVYLKSRGKTVGEGGLPNERAMVDEARALVVGQDPRVAARVLQEAAKSDQTRVDAWREHEDATGYVGSAPLNPTAVINAIAPEIAKITYGNKGEVGQSISAAVSEQYTTYVPVFDEKGNKTGTKRMTLPIPLNVVKAALAESDTNTFGFDRGGSAVEIIKRYMAMPDVQQAILTRMHAENLKQNLLSDPSMNAGNPKTERKR